MNERRMTDYEVRFERVLSYIGEHLGEELSLDELSRVAHFSKFHFHRLFASYTGLSVARYVQMLRLRQASHQLVHAPDRRIIDIALEAGFATPEAFSRAFKRYCGQTPSQFRKAPVRQLWSEETPFPNPPRRTAMDVQIVEFETTTVEVLEHRGPPDRINDSIGRFVDWRRQTGLSPKATARTFGIAYDNPDTTPPADFRFDICASVAGDVPANPQGVVSKVIDGGRCAYVRHQGPHEAMNERIYWLYRDWLPASGEELRDAPLFFHYLNFKSETPDHALLTDIYLPLK